MKRRICELELELYASKSWATTGSDNGLFVRHEAIYQN